MELRPILRSHHLFRSLDERTLASMASLWKTLDCRAGAVVVYEEEALDGLYLPRSGVWEIREAGGRRTVLPGEILGEAALTGPATAPWTLVCTTGGSLLHCPAEPLRRWLKTRPGARRVLGAGAATEVRSADGPVPTRWRRSFRLSLLRALPGAGLAAAGVWLALTFDSGRVLSWSLAGAGLLWLLLRLLARYTESLRLEGDILIHTRFDPAAPGIRRVRLPLDRVAGWEVRTDSLGERLLGVGSLVVRTGSGQEDVKFRELDRPVRIAETLRKARESRDAEREGRDRREIRRELERWFGRRNDVVERDGREDDTAPTEPLRASFRKSLAILAGRLLPPLAGGAASLWLGLEFGASLPALLAPLPAGGALAGALLALWRWMDWRDDRFQVRDGYILDIDRKPLGRRESRKLATLDAVQTVRAEQNGPLSLLFGFGDVTVITTGGSEDIVFEGVARPREVQAVLLGLRDAWLRRREEDEGRRLRHEWYRMNEVRDRMEAEGSLEPLDRDFRASRS